MVVSKLVVTSLLAGLCTVALCQTKAPEAQAVLDSARAQAAKENKNVLVMFSASWCQYCKKLDAFLSLPEIKPIVERNLVPIHIIVMERAELVANENAGGMDMIDWLGGRDQGIPFFAIVDPNGKTLASSLIPSEEGKPAANIGFPMVPQEIAHFMKMLKKGAPKITSDELKLIETKLSTPPKT